MKRNLLIALLVVVAVIAAARLTTSDDGSEPGDHHKPTTGAGPTTSTSTTTTLPGVTAPPGSVTASPLVAGEARETGTASVETDVADPAAGALVLAQVAVASTGSEAAVLPATVSGPDGPLELFAEVRKDDGAPRTVGHYSGTASGDPGPFVLDFATEPGSVTYVFTQVQGASGVVATSAASSLPNSDTLTATAPDGASGPLVVFALVGHKNETLTVDSGWEAAGGHASGAALFSLGVYFAPDAEDPTAVVSWSGSASNAWLVAELD